MLCQKLDTRLSDNNLAPACAQSLDGSVEHRAIGVRAGATKARRTRQEPVRFLCELQLREVDGLDIAYGEQTSERPLTKRREQERGPDNDDDHNDDRQVPKKRLHFSVILNDLPRMGSAIGHS